MKKLLLSIALFLIVWCSLGQQTVLPFKTFGGEQPDLFTHMIEMDNAEIWAVGASGSNLQGNSDVWLQRTNEALDCIESKTFGSSGVDKAECIVKDDLGNAYIIGYTNGYGAQEYDALVIKVNSEGDEVWVKTIGANDWDFATCGAWINGKLVVGGYSYLNAASSSVWTFELDEDGTVLSESFMGASGDAWMNDIMTTEDGNLLYMYTQKTAADFSEVLIKKVDNVGNELWTYLQNDDTHSMQGLGISEIDGVYYFTGKRDLNDLTSTFVLRLSGEGDLVEELIYEQTNDFYVMKVLPINDSRIFVMNTFTFGAGGCDGGYLVFSQYFGFLNSVTFGGTSNDFLHDAMVTSSGKVISCGEYNSYSDQLPQGMLVILPEVNAEGYSYQTVNDQSCFIVGVQEMVSTPLIDFMGNWQIYDLSGRKLAQYYGSEKQVKEELNLWPSGLYLMQAENGGAIKYLIGH
ncbi:MAG: hypothetical protein RLZZ77_2105 [Bacteroidota bacterium]